MPFTMIARVFPTTRVSNTFVKYYSLDRKRLGPHRLGRFSDDDTLRVIKGGLFSRRWMFQRSF